MTEDGLPPPTDAREQWTFEEALSVAAYPGYTWATFRDGESPRALGIRYLGQQGTHGWYEIATVNKPGDIAFSRWRFHAGERWTRCEA